MDVAWSDWTDEILDQMLCTEVHRLIHTSGAQARKQKKTKRSVSWDYQNSSNHGRKSVLLKACLTVQPYSSCYTWIMQDPRSLKCWHLTIQIKQSFLQSWLLQDYQISAFFCWRHWCCGCTFKLWKTADVNWTESAYVEGNNQIWRDVEKCSTALCVILLNCTEYPL